MDVASFIAHLGRLGIGTGARPAAQLGASGVNDATLVVDPLGSGYGSGWVGRCSLHPEPDSSAQRSPAQRAASRSVCRKSSPTNSKGSLSSAARA